MHIARGGLVREFNPFLAIVVEPPGSVNLTRVTDHLTDQESRPGKSADALPQTSPRRQHGLRIMRGHHGLGERQERRLLLQRVEHEIAKLRSDLPDALRLKEAELAAEERRLADFVDFIGEGPVSQALAKALVETERCVDQLAEDVEAPRRSRGNIFRPLPSSGLRSP